ncbi:MAG: hypothetical protein ACR2OD_01345, partial [Gaiellaceae bacterium]
YAQSNAASADRGADTSVAHGLAEAAMSHARSILWNAPDPMDPNAVPQGNVSLFGGTGTYTGQLSGNVWTLTGVSQVANGAQDVSTTVSTQVSVVPGGDGPAFAVFTADSDCGGDSLDLGPNTVEVDGAMRTNGDLVVSGPNASIAHVSAYGSPCIVDITHGGVTPEIDSSVHYWPATFEETDFVCTYRAATFRFSANSAAIPDGVYCADDSFVVTGNGVTGNITVLAPDIRVRGANHDLNPYQRDVLLFATGTEPMQLAGSSYQWAGIIFHPNGQVRIRGDEFSMLQGMIEAREVNVRGNAFRMIGTGPAIDLGGDGLTLLDVPNSYRTG